MDQHASQGMLYGLDDRPLLIRTLLYALQWIGFTLTQIVVVPIVLGPYLGLTAGDVVELAQRVLFFVGLGSLLQVLWGHRLPIVEGTAGMWWAIFISLGTTAAATGKPLATLRTDLELALMAAGLVTLLLGATGLVARMQQLFTPAVTGTAMVLLAVELSSKAVPTMLGAGVQSGGIRASTALPSLLTLACVALVSLYAPRWLRSFGILIGMVAGWLALAAIGAASVPAEPPSPLPAVIEQALPATHDVVPQQAAAPEPRRPAGLAWLFPWGMPTFDPGVVVVFIMTALLLTASQVAAVQVMQSAVGGAPQPAALNRSLVVTGITNVLCGATASLGLSSFASSAAVINLSGVASRLPFVIHAVLLMLLGLMPALAVALTLIPEPIGNAVLLAAAFQLFLIGVRQYATMRLSQRDTFVLGAAVTVGTGVMFVPDTALTTLPSTLQYIVGSGMMSGMIVAILAERLLPEPREAS